MMNFIKKLQNYRKTKFFQENVREQQWFILRWEILVIICFTFLAAFLNMLPNWIGDSETIYFQGGDRYVPNTLRDNLAYSSISMSITILVAIFIGVFTEIGRFAGKYSSALFALVPSLVWLLSDRSSNHIHDITKTANMLGSLIFWSIVTLSIIFILSWVLKHILATFALAYRTKEKIERFYSTLVRIIVVGINILILMMLAYSLVNYAIFTLHLANLSESAKEALKAAGNLAPGAYDLHSEGMTTFIALVAVIFALLMVSIGLSNIFASSSAVAIESEDASHDIKMISMEEAMLRVDDQWDEKMKDTVDLEGVNDE